ncbi:MAG: Smr/MutS family protein [Deltaproteobacteria bacterium]|nr:Smr/MutS family protein [Deltaproteobacteria bacterium]MBW1955884.1 Smr/MutS family protein [Deltaproteobacteria bacterium]MBW2042219.1 Smr/MutS family protein [Deltaproteobacteria bacterium]MBW2132574.1 Smr/MutS family protein [Deltaproteobacteria bacterium]
MKPVIVPIEEVLDLHTFRPEEVGVLLDDYFSECLKTGMLTVRIIHGKGKGILKQRVLRYLEKDPRVIAYRDADPGAGGWGATLVRLKPT